MEVESNRKRVCPLCGETIEYTVYSDDGTDWLGHRRSSGGTRTVGNEHKCDMIKFKRMCLNCDFNKSGMCVNKSTIELFKKNLDDKSPFVISINSLVIKKAMSKCNNWKISNDIIEEIFFK